MLRNSPAECDFSLTATWLSVRLSPCESTVPEIVPVGGAVSALCALALGIKLVTTRYRKRIGRNFARCNRFLGFRGSYSISTCRPLLRLPLGGLCGWERRSGRTRGATSSSHLMAAVVVSPAPPVHHFLWLPTVAHRAIFCYGKPAVCLVLYVAQLMPRISLPPACGKRLQTNKNHFASTVATFGICLNQRHPVNILTHIEIRGLLPCISSEELGAGSFGWWPSRRYAGHREGSRRVKPQIISPRDLLPEARLL